MKGNIFKKKIKGHTYYYYQESRREKIASSSEGKKGPGSGRSRVRTRSVYLGTAEQIYKRMRSAPEPVEAAHRDFGFVAALLQTAREIGLVDILQNHIPGKRFGIERWKYFLITILNRPSQATSKEKMGDWAAKTVLPDLLGFSPGKLNSKSFWYATDDVISEKELQKRRKEDEKISGELLAGLDDAVMREMENSLAQILTEHFSLEPESVLYDTTNFFTYIEAATPSALAATGHNKDCHHHLRQVGLALCVDKQWGIPFFHRVYRGNSQDSNTFSDLVDELIDQIKNSFPKIGNLVLVLDKGNNSRKNFKAMEDRIAWIGALVPSHYPDLLDIGSEQYPGRWKDTRFLSLCREVMGIKCLLVMTYNPALARRQERTLRTSVEKLKRAVREKIAGYKRPPKKVPRGALSILEKSRCGKYLRIVEIKDGKAVFEDTLDAWAERRKRFGKNLLFTTRTMADEGWVIEQYRQKDKIEQDFELLKNPELIRFRPVRHWTDTKIRAFGFCCVMSLVLLRVMLMKCEQAGIRMSAPVLKQELADLKEVIMVYSPDNAARKISRRGAVQDHLWKLFDLETLEKQVNLHKPLY